MTWTDSNYNFQGRKAGTSVKLVVLAANCGPKRFYLPDIYINVQPHLARACQTLNLSCCRSQGRMNI